MDLGLEGRTNLVAGANQLDYHFRNVTPGRDFTPTLIADIRNILEGEPDPIAGQPLRLGKAVEIGHIFKLGTQVHQVHGRHRSQPRRQGSHSHHGQLRHWRRAHPYRRHRDLRRSPTAATATPCPPPLRPSRSSSPVTNINEAALARSRRKARRSARLPPASTSCSTTATSAPVSSSRTPTSPAVPYRIAVGKKLAEGKVELLDRLQNTTTDLPLDADMQRYHGRCNPPRCTRIQRTSCARSMPCQSSRLALPPAPAAASALSVQHRSRVLVAVLLWPPASAPASFLLLLPRYQQVVDDRLAAGPLFASVAQIYAAPQEIRVGQRLHRRRIASELRSAGYNSNPQLGTFEAPRRLHPHQARPASPSTTPTAPPSPPRRQTCTPSPPKTAPSSAPTSSSRSSSPRSSEDKNRTKRRSSTSTRFPPHMVEAVTAIEDRRFFEHGGINYVRTVKCGIQDIPPSARTAAAPPSPSSSREDFFLTPDKNISRKLREIMITFQLESRFNKQQIFEMYANQINLGQRGSFAINGFGEAAQAFFGKTSRSSTRPSARCSPASSRAQLPLTPTAIRTAPWSGATSCSTPWSRPAHHRSRSHPRQGRTHPPRAAERRRERSPLLRRSRTRAARPAARRRLCHAVAAHLHLARPGAPARGLGGRRSRHAQRGRDSSAKPTAKNRAITYPRSPS